VYSSDRPSTSEATSSPIYSATAIGMTRLPSTALWHGQAPPKSWWCIHQESQRAKGELPLRLQHELHSELSSTAPCIARGQLPRRRAFSSSPRAFAAFSSLPVPRAPRPPPVCTCFPFSPPHTSLYMNASFSFAIGDPTTPSKRRRSGVQSRPRFTHVTSLVYFPLHLSHQCVGESLALGVPRSNSVNALPLHVFHPTAYFSSRSIIVV
jgi:hypothetical protein